MDEAAQPANSTALAVARGGVYLFALATIAAGVLDLIWGEFEAAHQPIRGLGRQYFWPKDIRLHHCDLDDPRGCGDSLATNHSCWRAGSGTHLSHIWIILVAALLFSTTCSRFSTHAVHWSVSWNVYTTNGRGWRTCPPCVGCAFLILAQNITGNCSLGNWISLSPFWPGPSQRCSGCGTNGPEMDASWWSLLGGGHGNRVRAGRTLDPQRNSRQEWPLICSCS